MDWNTFLQDASRLIASNQQSLTQFQYVKDLDQIYDQVYNVPPFPEFGNQEAENLTHMCFLLCHRSLLSAAMSILSGSPEDGAATTRRALEAAKLVYAISSDSANLTAWQQTRTRRQRWKDRGSATRLKPVSVQFQNCSGDLYDELQSWLGVLSDFTVHFTPEYVHQYDWRENQHGVQFGLEQDALVREIIVLAGCHYLILKTFDHCLQGRLLTGRAVRQLYDNVGKAVISGIGDQFDT
jgi:hypothetical protein